MDPRLAISIGCVALTLGVGTSRLEGRVAEPLGRGLDIYLIDVEGGGATLIVTPEKQSILIDAGWKTKELRDSKRILAVMRRADLDHIDYLIVSHYHSDHVGGVVELIPQTLIHHFLDRGLMTEPIPYVSRELYSEYIHLSKGRRRQVGVGERIRLRAAKEEPVASLLILACNGQMLRDPRGERNPACDKAQEGPMDPGENSNSVAVLLQYGNFRYLAGADLPQDEEFRLVCPTNKIGRINVYQVDHHGKSVSSNPVLLSSIHAQVAIMNNGLDKGGDASVINALRDVMSPENIYGIHRNVRTTDEENAIPKNLANGESGNDGFGFEIHVSQDSSSYQVINERTHEARDYATHQ